MPALASGEEARQYVHIPSRYSDKELVIDGYDNDWEDDQTILTTHFSGIPSPQLFINQNNSLSGQIQTMNNETHLAIFIKLNTLYPIENQYRSVYLSFDENGDGVYSAGDNALMVTSQESSSESLFDLYITDESIPKLDPSQDTKTFQAFLRYVSNSEITIEILVPFKETNDFYDIKMNSPLQFDFLLAYTAGQPDSISYSSFGAPFTYLMAQNSGTSLIPGIQIFSIFALTVIISIVVLTILVGKKIPPKLVLFASSKKPSIFILLALIVSVAIVFLNPLVIEDIISNFRLLSLSTVNQNFAVIMIYAGMLGVLPALFTIKLFKRSEDFISRSAFEQQFLLKGPLVLLVIQLIQIAATPVLFIIMGVPAIAGYSEIVENIRSNVSLLQEFIGVGINQIAILGIFYCFSIWIPSGFLISTLYDVSVSHLKSKAKIALITISSVLFVIIALWNVFGLFIGSPVNTEYVLLLMGPTIAAVLFSFLAAQGYINTIKESFNKLRGNHVLAKKQLDKRNPKKIRKIFKVIGINLGAIFVLTLSVIGMSKNLFLLTIPFVSISFPLGLSPINDIFINIVSSHAVSINSGQNLAAAKLVYNSFVIFFSLFWLYDIIMMLRGLGEEFLNSENLVYKTLKTHVGSLTSLSFLSIITLFTVNSYFLDFGFNEINRSMPLWVKETIGIQDDEIQILSNLSSQFGLFIGISTLLGVIYVTIRSKSRFKNWLTSLLNIDSK
jgi:hypothetical protein